MLGIFSYRKAHMRVQVRLRMQSRWNEWKYKFGKSSILNFSNKTQSRSRFECLYCKVRYRRGTIIAEPLVTSIPPLLLSSRCGDMFVLCIYQKKTYICVCAAVRTVIKQTGSCSCLPANLKPRKRRALDFFLSFLFMGVHSSTFTLSQNGLPQTHFVVFT